MSDLTTSFTNYFTAFREHYPDTDIVFTRAVPHNADTQTDAEAYAKEKGLSFTASCYKRSHTDYDVVLAVSSSYFELCLIQKYLPSVTIPALAAAADATGVHVVFHVDPPTLEYGSRQNHSIVFKPGPEGWIQDLYRDIAKGKLVAAAPDGRNHGLHHTTSITYDGTYGIAVNNVIDMLDDTHKVYDPRVFLKNSLHSFDCAKRDAEWMLDYRRLMGTDLTFEFAYKKHEGHYEMTCGKCTAVMHPDRITYQCHCPPATPDIFDEKVRLAKSKYSLK